MNFGNDNIDIGDSAYWAYGITADQSICLSDCLVVCLSVRLLVCPAGWLAGRLAVKAIDMQLWDRGIRF